MNAKSTATYFDGPTGVLTADTCSPLKAASEFGAVDLFAYGRGSYPGELLKPDMLPQLKSVGTWEAVADQEWGLDWHRNEGIEFTCVSGGSLEFSCEDDEYELVAGDITITRPWQLHRVGRPWITSSTLTWFILDLGVRRPNQEWVWPPWIPIPSADLTRLTELLSHNERPVWRANKALLGAVSALDKTLRRESSQQMARIATATTEVLIELRDLLEQEASVLTPYLSSTERTVRLFLAQLVDRIDAPWTVDQMATECGLGRTRFAHYCKQITNVAPLDYLNTVRVQRAAEMLTHTDIPITEVAYQCGYQSSQYFATAFRRVHKRRPLEYRRQHTLR